MSAHQYRITLEYLGGKHARPERHVPLTFEAGNHDDLFQIIQNVRASQLYDQDTAAALALGMKLFGEVMLQHGKDPMFAPLVVAYREYIGTFKQRMQAARQQHDAARGADGPQADEPQS